MRYLFRLTTDIDSRFFTHVSHRSKVAFSSRRLAEQYPHDLDQAPAQRCRRRHVEPPVSTNSSQVPTSEKTLYQRDVSRRSPLVLVARVR